MEFEKIESGGAIVFELSGFLKGRPTGYDMLDEIRSAFSSGTGKLVIDMSKIEGADSSGLGVVASIITSAENAGAALAFSAVPANVDKLLKMVRLNTVMKIYGSTDEKAKAL